MKPFRLDKSRSIIVALLLMLLAGCGPAAPAATDVPVAATPAPPTATVEPTAAIPATATAQPTTEPAASTSAGDGVVRGWAILAQKDDYTDVQMTNLPVGYIGIIQMREVLEQAGWDSAHIREDREFDRASLVAGLDWLEENADQDDIALLYVAAHGMYLQRVLSWETFFADEWREIPSHRRVLLIDSCQAAQYTGVALDDPAPFLAIAAVGEDEYGWSGLEEEGLPIIGGVFTHYFAAALNDRAADADGDGYVSILILGLRADASSNAELDPLLLAVDAATRCAWGSC